MSDPTLEDRAAQMGWVPVDKFRGDPAHWVDAETFVKKGEEVMPILRANNRRLEEKRRKRVRQAFKYLAESPDPPPVVRAIREEYAIPGIRAIEIDFQALLVNVELVARLMDAEQQLIEEEEAAAEVIVRAYLQNSLR